MSLTYDLEAACENNGIDPKRISSSLLEITGENDEQSWHWILVLADGRFAYMTGWCDYTGWDCQSNADVHEADTLAEALALAPQDERRIFEEMMRKGEVQRPARPAEGSPTAQDSS